MCHLKCVKMRCKGSKDKKYSSEIMRLINNSPSKLISLKPKTRWLDNQCIDIYIYINLYVPCTDCTDCDPDILGHTIDVDDKRLEPTVPRGLSPEVSHKVLQPVRVHHVSLIKRTPKQILRELAKYSLMFFSSMPPCAPPPCHGVYLCAICEQTAFDPNFDGTTCSRPNF